VALPAGPAGLFALPREAYKTQTMSAAPPQSVFSLDTCPLCGSENACTFGSGETPCWCATTSIPIEVLGRVPDEARNKTCVCRACADAAFPQADN
jgi:cysteine-rich CWC protein